MNCNEMMVFMHCLNQSWCKVSNFYTFKIWKTYPTPVE